MDILGFFTLTKKNYLQKALQVTVLIFLLTGLLVGLFSSFFGIGGGIIIVPVLYLLFPKMLPPSVIASSLGFICLNSSLNTWNFSRLGQTPPKKIILFLGSAMILGTLAGSQTVAYISPSLVKKIFGITLLLVSLKIFLSHPAKALHQVHWKNWPESISFAFLIKVLLMGILSGLLSGLTGLGGGIILVPFFLMFLKMPIQWVSVYSNASMVLGSAAGIINFMLKEPPNLAQIPPGLHHFQIGLVNWAIIFSMLPGSFLTSRLGAKLALRMSSQLVQKLFGILLLVFGIRFMLK